MKEKNYFFLLAEQFSNKTYFLPLYIFLSKHHDQVEKFCLFLSEIGLIILFFNGLSRRLVFNYLNSHLTCKEKANLSIHLAFMAALTCLTIQMGMQYIKWLSNGINNYSLDNILQLAVSFFATFTLSQSIFLSATIYQRLFFWLSIIRLSTAYLLCTWFDIFIDSFPISRFQFTLLLLVGADAVSTLAGLFLYSLHSTPKNINFNKTISKLIIPVLISCIGVSLFFMIFNYYLGKLGDGLLSAFTLYLQYSSFIDVIFYSYIYYLLISRKKQVIIEKIYTYMLYLVLLYLPLQLILYYWLTHITQLDIITIGIINENKAYLVMFKILWIIMIYFTGILTQFNKEKGMTLVLGAFLYLLFLLPLTTFKQNLLYLNACLFLYCILFAIYFDTVISKSNFKKIIHAGKMNSLLVITSKEK